MRSSWLRPPIARRRPGHDGGLRKGQSWYKVNLEFVPYEGLRDKTLLAQGSGGYDVVLFDVIWPAEFATNMCSST